MIFSTQQKQVVRSCESGGQSESLFNWVERCIWLCRFDQTNLSELQVKTGKLH